MTTQAAWTTGTWNSYTLMDWLKILCFIFKEDSIYFVSMFVKTWCWSPFICVFLRFTHITNRSRVFCVYLIQLLLSKDKYVKCDSDKMCMYDFRIFYASSASDPCAT